MLEFEVAAIYYFVNSELHLTPYFDKVPNGMLIPCVFYPIPEFDTESFSTSAYQTNFTMYVKLFDVTNLDVATKASQLTQAIVKARNKIPLYNAQGRATGKNFRVEKVTGNKIEEGVFQLQITWKRRTKFTQESATKAQEFFLNGIPL